jgi:UTP--glucose-1-phosphate uridylyltransferase
MYCADSRLLSTEDAVRDALLTNQVLQPDQRARFMTLFSLYTKQKDQKNISLDDYECLREKNFIQRDSISDCPADDALRRELLDKMAVVKLNGGLGSTMGCNSIPKSAIEVRNGSSFLDLGVRQIEYLNSLHGMDIPLILMNSFKTHQVTTKFIRKYRNHNLTIHTILQNCFPRISKTTMMPIPHGPFNETPGEEWYPPGNQHICINYIISYVLCTVMTVDYECLLCYY